MKKTFLALAANITLTIPLSTAAYAITIPPFTDCVAPSGTVKASYDNGTHGIVGNSGIFTGSDKVYTISDKSLTQCFCPNNGDGIQTNWFKVSNLTENEIDSLKNQGWILVLDGSIWGLEKAPYLAKNHSFNCKGGVGGTEISKTYSIDYGDGTGGGEILGLATTGTAKNILALTMLGLGFIIGGFSLKKIKIDK